MSWDYWYVFPFAVAVATTANASGFSGAVLFQPFFLFVLQLPLEQSIATGVATETIGMSSGASRYYFMRKVDLHAIRLLLLPVLFGVMVGLYIFTLVPITILRLIVGGVIGGIAILQLYHVWHENYGKHERANLEVLQQRRLRSFCAGAFSACTGTGVAELHQPMLEQEAGLSTKRANATAIFLEALADWAITVVNLSLGNLRFDVLVFSAAGVLFGAQLGAFSSTYLPDRLLKTTFAVAILGISLFYISRSLLEIWYW